MKNYTVKAIINFNDTKEKNEYGLDTPRKIGDMFECDKERYEFLKSHNAVVLVGIKKVESPIEKVEQEYTEELKKKTTRKRKKVGDTNDNN